MIINAIMMSMISLIKINDTNYRNDVQSTLMKNINNNNINYDTEDIQYNRKR